MQINIMIDESALQKVNAKITGDPSIATLDALVRTMLKAYTYNFINMADIAEQMADLNTKGGF